MPNGHGGARPGSGPKPKAIRHAEPIASFIDMCAQHAKPTFWRLWELINPKPRYERKYLPSCLVTRKGVATEKNEDGEDVIVRDDKGKPAIVDVRIFPDDPPEKLRLVEKRRIDQMPDMKAIRELCDRLMDRPAQAVEIIDDSDPLAIDDPVRSQASIELEAWRKEMFNQLSKLQSAPPTMPTSSTPME